MENVPAIEGITPTYLWYFLIVAVGLCAIALLVVNLIKGLRELRKPKAGKSDAILDRLGSIDTKLGNDKARLDGHETRLNALEQDKQDIQAGFSVMCTALLAVLNHELHNGNADEMERATDELTKYLTRRII